MVFLTASCAASQNVEPEHPSATPTSECTTESHDVFTEPPLRPLAASPQPGDIVLARLREEAGFVFARVVSIGADSAVVRDLAEPEERTVHARDLREDSIEAGHTVLFCGEEHLVHGLVVERLSDEHLVVDILGAAAALHPSRVRVPEGLPGGRVCA
jgi:hypothetical protein